jgi:ElaB/YqjD/DUF883 family membrane-anchored ribosome-binding protein
MFQAANPDKGEIAMQNTGMQGSTPTATATQSAQDITSRASEKLSNMTSAAQETVDRWSSAASQAANRLSQRGEELWEMRGQAADTARTYMREHPLATIGIAVAVGLILSRLLSRR